MTILDTNVLSALARPVPDRSVRQWLDKQSPSSIWTTSITILEIRFGVQIMPVGKRRSLLMQAIHEFLDEIDHRIISFDSAAAERAGDLMASRRFQGRPVELRDTMIAGIVLAQHATLATRNVAHFEGTSIPIINPWSA